MWVRILFLKFSTQHLYFLFFSPKFCFKILCLISFSNISSKICPSYFLFFYKFDHMSFFTHFYTNPLYLNLFVQINRYGLFLCVYILYIFLYKLYNFRFSLGNCDLDLT